ncbi:ABC transporter substrate-binding protein [Phytohabitans kaempferiae]|uniref:ABC transporter substrate-binding protein n=1 Tax=Phytohabitans kaempferiae TaxID=1620943 RepID=A0ABV6LZN2_9ACTN
MLLAAGALVACGGDGDQNTAGGGVVTMATWSATKSLDPTQAAATGNSAGAEIAAIYDTIMRYDPESGTFEPHTAESLTPNADFTQWTLKLRPNIKFSDGTAYDAAAVVANLKRHVETRSNTVSLVAPITKYDTPDDLTVVFTLSFPWNGFPFALASGPGMVVSPAAVQKLGDGLGTNPVGAGAGPFVIDSFRANESVTLKRNPDYWGGQVAVEGLKFIYAGTGAQTYEAFRAGTVQVAFLRDPASVAEAKADGVGGFTQRFSANDTLIMNNGITVTCQKGEPAPKCAGKADGTEIPSTAPTKDKRVRQAVAAAIDLQTLNQRVYNGAGEVTTDLIAQQSRWYDGVTGPAYDVARAKSLVAEAKAAGWNGQIRVSCHTGLPTWGTAVKGMLEAAGFQVNLTDQQEIAANTSAVIVRKDFDIACFGSSISDAEPFFAINRDFNSAFVKSGGGNYSGYVNPAVDQAIAAGRAAGDEAAMKAAISTVARAYTEDVPFLVLTSQPEQVLVSEKLTGLVLNASTVVMFHDAKPAS